MAGRKGKKPEARPAKPNGVPWAVLAKPPEIELPQRYGRYLRTEQTVLRKDGGKRG